MLCKVVVDNNQPGEFFEFDANLPVHPKPTIGSLLLYVHNMMSSYELERTLRDRRIKKISIDCESWLVFVFEGRLIETSKTKALSLLRVVKL